MLRAARGAVACAAFALSLMLPAAAGAAEPNGYGELARFGLPGTLGGQESAGSFGKLDEIRTKSIGVDPTDNSVYVLDETQEPVGAKHTVRLQKFVDPSKTGSYVFAAGVTFTVKSPEVKAAEPTFEGLVVDPSEERVYLLEVDGREGKLSQASEHVDKTGVLVAARLFAFSTKQSGEKLVPATGTKEEETLKGVVAGPAELAAQSTVPGEALLEPHGITLDPQTHEVIILAHIDEAAGKVDEVSNAADHYVLQRVTAGGALGARYVDAKDKLKEKTESGVTPAVVSPVVAAVEVEGKQEERVFVQRAGLAEIPYEFKSSEPPKILAPAIDAKDAVNEGINDPVGELDGLHPGHQGGTLTAAPDGTLYGSGTESIFETPTSAGLDGLVAFSPLDGSVIGWSGGQQVRGSEAKCAITDRIFGLPPGVAAGSEGKVFVLANEFLLHETIFEVEKEPEGSEEFETIIEPLPEPYFPAIIEFGPGGTGCPRAEATPPAATYNGSEVKPEETVPKGAEVTFFSQLKVTDAVKVEWEFGDGTPKEVVTKLQYPVAHVEKPHKFETEGTFTVTEKIYTDNLSAPTQPVYKAGHLTTPTITVTRQISVGLRPPHAQFLVSKETAIVGEAITFTNVSSDPNGKEALPLTSAWTFGDGASEGDKSPVAHAYAAPGRYKITLKVTDKLGQKAEISREVTVNPAPKPEEKHEEPKPEEKHEEPKHEVLSYSVSIAGSSVAVTKSGKLTLKVDCSGQSSCTGTVTLRSASAVAASGKHKSVLTLASASFSLAGGQVKVITLHLSAKARAYLARVHALKARATIVAKDASGSSHTTQASLTLKLSKHR